ncbi:DNA polymerase III subunit beta [Carnobacteriaceae bacterium zg-ZUI78]|uniref:DNA polymerase III subunit beta n=1 Tax=Granulicatella sp. zg-84 TaxID=2678503 RepID=UPI0013C24B8A|nr:DNA polymerase III subunit beta [Granulicatella sp. zg-84]MBS4750242.1 DNA polymerase III subunit beta [Carnobacteriaceae bacterium zg-ZUI78]NEW66910.1 DNA polymerase III subunit beta [Granulicatella sp. zg-84]QMI85820.1 DNA polymerase III subunit beta [Carnobacteriaceae bacterium zg-84]
MKFTINRHVFLKHLSDVQRAITSKTTIPVLTGVKLALTTNELVLTGSDASISIEKIISSDIEENELDIIQTGSIVLPARFFGEIIRKLSGKDVQITLLENNKVEIVSDKSVFTINGIDAELYPIISNIDIEENQTISIASFLFKNVLSQTIFAASTSENRPILTGIHLVVENGQLITTATDSHRMSRRIILLPSISKDISYQCTIPAKSLVELSRILSDEEDVKMTVSDNKVLFTTENLYFYSRLVEGIYPDVSRLLKNQYETTFKVESSIFLQSVERASILSTEGKNDIVTLTLNKNSFISSESAEIGYVEEELDMLSFEGKPMKISFNPNYMKDALKAFQNQKIEINLIEEGKPFTLKLDEENDYFVQLITPIRTRN